MQKQWTTSMMRADARFHLKGAWGPAIGVTVLMGLINYLVSGIIGAVMSVGLLGSSVAPLLNNRAFWQDPEYYMEHYAQYFDPTDLVPMLAVFLLMFLLVLAASLFVQQPLTVSAYNWFNRNRETPIAPNFGLFFNHFTSNYKNLMKGVLWKNLWIFLWSLIPMVGIGLTMGSAVLLTAADQQMPGTEGRMSLFYIALALLIVGYIVLIAGSVIVINRGLAYAQAYFILADNPGIGSKRALQLSKKMMKGQKWHYIGLQFSFIGWILLASFATCGLGVMFLQPYILQTNSELYAKLRSNAVMDGHTTMEELGFIPMV